jgi:hypothetical protein
MTHLYTDNLIETNIDHAIVGKEVLYKNQNVKVVGWSHDGKYLMKLIIDDRMITLDGKTSILARPEDIKVLTTCPAANANTGSQVFYCGDLFYLCGHTFDDQIIAQNIKTREFSVLCWDDLVETELENIDWERYDG